MPEHFGSVVTHKEALNTKSNLKCNFFYFTFRFLPANNILFSV